MADFTNNRVGGNPLIYQAYGGVFYTPEELPDAIVEALTKPVMDHILYAVARKKLGIYDRGLHPDEYTTMMVAVLECTKRFDPYRDCAFFSYAIATAYYTILGRRALFHNLPELEPLPDSVVPLAGERVIIPEFDDEPADYRLSELLLACITLTDTERGVIAHLAGLTDGGPLSVQEIADAMIVTRARVDQIKQNALAKLRRLARNLEHDLPTITPFLNTSTPVLAPPNPLRGCYAWKECIVESAVRPPPAWLEPLSDSTSEIALDRKNARLTAAIETSAREWSAARPPPPVAPPPRVPDPEDLVFGNQFRLWVASEHAAGRRW